MKYFHRLDSPLVISILIGLGSSMLLAVLIPAGLIQSAAILTGLIFSFPALAAIIRYRLFTKLRWRRLSREIRSLRTGDRIDVGRRMSGHAIHQLSLISAEIDELTHSLNSIFLDITRSTQKFSLFSSDIFFSARELSDLSKAQSLSMKDILEQVETFRHSLGELDSQIGILVREIEQNAQTYRELGERSRSSGEQLKDLEELIANVSSETASSRRSVEASTESVTRLEETFTTMDQRMRDLSERTASTGMIVKSLEDVAERTHVLATNASIEAARAGKLGAGFSVIAGEIRKLAESSRDAIGEVDSLLKGTAESVSEGTASWDREMARVSEIREFSAVTLAALSRVDEQIEGIRASTGLFAREYEEQIRAVEESLGLSDHIRRGILALDDEITRQGKGYEETASGIGRSAKSAVEASRSAVVLAQLATYLRFGGQELRQIAGRVIVSEERRLEGIARREARRVLLYNLEVFEAGKIIGYLGDLSLSGLMLYSEMDIPVGESRKVRIRLPIEFGGDKYIDVEIIARRVEKSREYFQIGCSMRLLDPSMQDDFLTVLSKLTLSEDPDDSGIQADDEEIEEAEELEEL